MPHFSFSFSFPALLSESLDCALVCADDLEHEVVGRFVPLAPGLKPVHLPIILRTAASHCLYVRMHRRQGKERILHDWEFKEWAERIHQALQDPVNKLEGPIYWIIGTGDEIRTHFQLWASRLDDCSWIK